MNTLGDQTTMTDLIKRHLIADLQLIDTLVANFVLVASDNDNWTKTYLDKENNEQWVSYYVDTAQHGGGNNILGRLPIPPTEELIDIALYSDKEDEIFAACRTLTENEKIRKEDFRLTLIEKLEQLNGRNRQKKVIELTGLLSALNRRDIVGKAVEQIQADANYFRQIANRADKIK